MIHLLLKLAGEHTMVLRALFSDHRLYSPSEEVVIASRACKR